MDKVLAVIFGIAVFAAIIVFAPLALVWAINTLWHTNTDYNFYSWLAAFVIMSFLGGSSAASLAKGS